MVRRGHEVHVLTSMPNYPVGEVYDGYEGFAMEEEIDGVRVIRSWIFPSKSTQYFPRMASYISFAASSAIVGALRLPTLDYLLTESPPLFLGATGYVLSRMKQARWIFNISDLWPASALSLGVVNEGLKYRLAEMLEEKCYHKAWMVTGQSKEILEDIQQRFPHTRTYHFSNGVNTTRFRPDLGNDSMRRKLGEKDGCIAIYAGLHGMAQGLDQVLDAATCLQDVTDLTISFIGDGPERERLMAKSKSMNLANVRFLPPFSWERMPEVVASADIAIVPLIHRIRGAVPSKLYENMGAGVPVVLAADGEAADILREADAGIVVSPGNAEALAAALRRLAESKEGRQSLGAAGRRAAVLRYDRERIADAFIDLLEHEKE